MPGTTNEQILLLTYRLEKAEKEIENLHKEMDTKAAEEKSRLMWGISFLGGIVMMLAGVIWTWRSVIFLRELP